MKSKGKQAVYSDPKKTGQGAVIAAIISLFIIPWMGFFAGMMGLFGIYSAIKHKAGTSAIVWNVLAVVLGFGSYMLAQIVNQ